jgi:hypothetical protein
MQLPAVYAWPTAITALVAVALRWVPGSERLRRIAGIALPLGFLVPWAIAVAPGWLAYDSFGRLGHIVFGATLLGLVLDLTQPRRAIVVTAVLVFAIGCAWAESQNAFVPAVHKIDILRFAVTTALAVAVLWRIDRVAGKDHSFANPGTVALIVIVVATLATAAIALVTKDRPLEQSGLLLCGATLGFLIWLWCTDALLPVAALLPAAAGLLALAWSMFDRDARVLPGLVLAGLILFADGTAARVPLPQAGISRVLHPAILAGIALLPGLLAVAVTVALRHL